VQEPGLDRHEWETEWEALEPLVHDSPADALPELDRLVERMLRERGFDLEEDATRSGEEREVVDAFRSAHEITRLLEGGADLSPGDVPTAVEGYREVYQYLIAERSAP
jgi:hypothetical protein